MSEKLDLILKELQTLNNRVTSLESGQKELLSNQKTFESRQQTLESGQKEIHQIVTALRDRQDETDAKLESLTMNVHKIHGTVTGHTELINRIVKTQERQEKILETLALRSIEHETELREFKRIK